MKQAHPDMTSRMTMISEEWLILKRPLELFFLAFCGVINQNVLHRRVYIAVSSLKRLLHQFCEKPLHIIFKACGD